MQGIFNCIGSGSWFTTIKLGLGFNPINLGLRSWLGFNPIKPVSGFALTKLGFGSGPGFNPVKPGSGSGFAPP